MMYAMVFESGGVPVSVFLGYNEDEVVQAVRIHFLEWIADELSESHYLEAHSRIAGKQGTDLWWEISKMGDEWGGDWSYTQVDVAGGTRSVVEMDQIRYVDHPEGWVVLYKDQEVGRVWSSYNPYECGPGIIWGWTMRKDETTNANMGNMPSRREAVLSLIEYSIDHGHIHG